MKIVVADDMEKEVIERLGTIGKVIHKPNDLVRELADADILVVRSATKVDKNILNRTNSLKMVARAGIGLDNVDVEECRRKGIKVINTPNASTTSVAELTICLMIAMMRKLMKANELVRNKKWNKKELVGNEIFGKTLGIIGLGRIGSEVARIASAFGVKVIAYDPFIKKSESAKLIEFDELLSNSDIISLHLPLTEDTRHLVNSDTIAKMKDGVFLLNMARGEIVDEDALYNALKVRKIAFASLDVLSKEPYDGKLLELDNVIFSSHIGANTIEAQRKIGEELIEKIREVI